MWPEVLKAEPQAELHTFYGDHLLRMPSLSKAFGEVAEEVARLSRELPRVVVHGGLPHGEMLAACADADVWAYPSGFPEISCIVAMEMQALGVQPVACDYAALGETVIGGMKVNHEVMDRELEAHGGARTQGPWWYPEGCWSATFLESLLRAISAGSSQRDELSEAAIARFPWYETGDDLIPGGGETNVNLGRVRFSR
jgi:glycosyltransferase involved in cell wall biosynthesis